MRSKTTVGLDEAALRRGRAPLAVVLSVILGLGGAGFGGAPAFAQQNAAQVDTAPFEALKKRTDELFNQGKHEEAADIAEQTAKAAEQAETARGKPGLVTASALNSLVWHSLFAKRFDKAFEASERAASLAPGDLGVLGNRAHALMFRGRAEEAQALYVEHKGETVPGLGKWEDVVAGDFNDMSKRGLSHPTMDRVKQALAAAPESLTALMMRGLELYKAAKPADAFVAFQKYAEAVKTRKGESHPDYSQALKMQMVCLQAQQKYVEAQPLMRKLLELNEKNLGPDHPQIAQDLNLLAMSLQLSGRAAEAEPLFRRALAIEEKSSGADSPKTASALNSLGLCLQALGRLTDAEPLHRRALAIDEKSQGAESPATASDLDTVAGVLVRLNHLNEAEPLYRRSLAIQEKTLGPEHIKVASVLLGLSQLLQNTNRFAEAETLLRRSLAIQEKNLGPEHINVAVSLNNLALMLRTINRNAEAEPLLRRAIANYEKVYGPEHPSMGAFYGNLAAVLQTLNRFDETEPLLRRALTIAEKTYGAEHPSVALAVGNLAHLFAETNRFAEAEPLERRALAINEKSLGADHPQTATSVRNLGALLWETGRYAEAEPLMRRALAAAEKNSGPEHTDTAASLDTMASLFHTTNRLAEAEPLYRRALAIDEKQYGADHPTTALRMSNLAVLLDETNRAAEAERLYRRALAVTEKSSGRDHADVALRLNNLGAFLSNTSRTADAEPLYRRALAINEKTLGPDHPSVALTLGNLANLLFGINRLGEAEPLYERALAINEKSYGPDHPRVALTLTNMATFLRDSNRLTEAEPLFRRALAIREKAYGDVHPHVAETLNTLGLHLREENRPTDAEPLLRRAIAIYEKSYGPDHPKTAAVWNSLAIIVEDDDNRLAEAETLYRRALATFEKGYVPDSGDTAAVLNNLGHLLARDKKRAGESEPLYRRALAVYEKVYGPDHPDIAFVLWNLAAVLRDTNRIAEAEPLLRRAMTISEQGFSAQHPSVAKALNNLARWRAKRGDWRGALGDIRRSSAIHIANARDMRAGGGDGEKRLLSKNADQFRDHVLIAHRAAPGDATVRDDAFAMAQRAAASEAAGALAQALARFASGSGALAELTREQQDLAGKLEASNRRLLAALGKADAETANALRAEQARLEARLNDIAAQLAKDHPDYTALATPEPLTVAAAQGLLAPDEALVQFLDVRAQPYSPLPATAFAFVITKAEALWIELPLASTALADRVTALRCGLDSSAWKEQSGQCSKLLGKAAPGDNLPPFDLKRAHELYRDLFGKAEEVIKDKRLLVAPSGALSRLPLQVLVTEAPDPSAKGAEAYAKAKWLGARNAISVLPSAASLRLLRMGKQGSASDPFIGFGNPLLDGGGGDRSAWSKQACGKTPELKTAASRGGRRSANRANPPSLAAVYHEAVADVEALRRAAPLPETADELCAVAQKLGAPESAVYLGERATVSQIKALSASGVLGRARTVHFATHGLVAGETAVFVHNRAEPALLMTPPSKDKATPEDDGLLKASDVTALKINADWVVMSACNTAAGGEGGEALSGLARAFFYAGARSMLVSHWYVDSGSAVAITTEAFSALRSDPAIGRDEALRRSLVKLIAKGGDDAHPAMWAPFVLVGDSGRTATLGGVGRKAAVEQNNAVTQKDVVGQKDAVARKDTVAQEDVVARKDVGGGKTSVAFSTPTPSVAPTAAPRGLKLDDAGGQPVAGLAFSPDGRHLLGATPTGAVVVWDARTGASVRKLTAGGANRIFGFSANGRLLAVPTQGSRTKITLWDTERGQSAGVIRASDGARFSRDAATLSPDGQSLAAEQYGASPSGTAIGVWDTGSARLIRVLEGRFDDVHALVFSPDGGRLAVIDAKGRLSVWNAQTGKAAFPAPVAASAKLAAFSSDGLWLASAGAGGDVKVWDARTGRQIKAIASRTAAISAVAFSTDGRLLIASADGRVEVREAPAGTTSAARGRR